MIAEVNRKSSQNHRSTSGVDASGIEATDVWFTYDGKNHVVKGVTIRIPPAGVTMLMGRSGSGKTTLLKLFQGLLRPQAGQIKIGASLGENGSAGSHIAYIPQTLGLVRSMTALDNALMGALRRTGTLRSVVHSFPKWVVEEAREVFGALGIAHKGDEPVYRLSGGERQRVAIARALMQRPSLILADEFVSQLDPITAEEILRMAKAIAGRGTGFLITTHETDVVAEYADRVVVMAGGRITHESAGGSLSIAEMLELLR